MSFYLRHFQSFFCTIASIYVFSTSINGWHNLSPADVKSKIVTCLKLHAKHKEITSELTKRIMSNFYFYIDPDGNALPQHIKEKWTTPNDQQINKIKNDIENNHYEEFSSLVSCAQKTYRKKQVSTKMITEIAQSLKSNEPIKNMTYGAFLKAFATSLDSHSQYLTEYEIQKFISAMQQETIGIGVVIEKNEYGAKIVEVIEGGPIHKCGKASSGDIITKVNESPIHNKTTQEIVSLLKGEENSSVNICLLKNDSSEVEISVVREKVCVEKRRLEIFKHPIGKDMIAICALHCFYGGKDRSCSEDLAKAIKNLKAEFGSKLKAIVLDLRNNLGGLLMQGIEVTNIFIKSGVVVSIKDGNGDIQTFRHFGEKTIWTGPLFVLISKTSASCAEIVSQALQDYGRAIIMGDERSFGKGSFQTFISNPNFHSVKAPTGDVKLTRGIYYTVSGKSPQNTGVLSDIVIPSLTNTLEVGESFGKWPLENDHINEKYEDSLDDMPIDIRSKLLTTYKSKQQKHVKIYNHTIDMMIKNSYARILNDNGYQQYIKMLDSHSHPNCIDVLDFQMHEALNIVKDFVHSG